MLKVKKPRRNRLAARVNASESMSKGGNDSNRPGKIAAGNASKRMALPVIMLLYLLNLCTAKNAFYFNNQPGAGISYFCVGSFVLKPSKDTFALDFHIPLRGNE